MAYENNELYVNEAEHRFEMMIDHEKAFIDYKQQGKKVYLIHTEVPAEMEGKGIASALVEKTLAYAEQHHLRVVPLCSYVQAYLQKHSEWNQLVLNKE